jgi:glucose/arabinose dehydrogenase
MRAGLAALLVLAALAAPAQAAPRFEPVPGAYVQPIYLTAPPRDTTRLFVVEKGGLVKVVVDGVPQAAPFLDVSTLLSPGDERGLLGLAFPPDYESSGLAYTYLTGPGGELQVREHRRSAANPNVTEAGSRLVWSQPHGDAANHNGGTIEFGPDGLLWLAPGDGGLSNDQLGHAQNLDSQLGKLLRIDPRPSGGRQFTVPAGNPYTGAAETVWAAGLRNPFRFSFDRGTGDLVIGDVGQGRREEIDWVRFDETLGRGGNFGWACFEGNLSGPKACTPPGYIPPVFDYSQSAPRAVAGGVVVRDPSLPTLVGRYLFADTYEGQVRSLVLGRPATDVRDEALPPRTLLAAFGEDACGRVYVVALSGTVDRIADGPLGACVLKPDPRPLPGLPGDGGQPPPPGSGTAGPDTRRPTVRVQVRGRRSLATRRRLRVAVQSDEAAALTLAGRLRGVAGFRTARRQLAAGQRRVVSLRISRKAARKLRRTLRRKRVIVRLTIHVQDAAGNVRSTGRRIVVPRR